MNFRARIICIALLVTLPLFSQGQWTQLSTGVTSDIGCVRYNASGQVWAGTLNGVLRSSNNGSTFNFVNGINTSAGNSQIFGSFDDIHITGPSSAVAVGFFYLGNDLIVFGTLNNGNSWSHNYYSNGGAWPRNFEAFDFTPGGIGVAVGGNGRAFNSTTNGANWTAGNSGTTNDLYDVSWVNGNVWVAVSGTNIHRTTNNGGSFTSVLAGQGSIESVSFAKGTNTGYAGGSNTFLKSTDGGITWNAVPIPSVSIRTIFTLSPDTVFIGTFDGVYRSVSGGSYWERFDLPGFPLPNDIYFYDASNGMIAGDSGYIAVTSNGGGPTFPVANFSLGSNSPCQGGAISVTNFGDTNWSYQWLLNGTLISSQFAPSISFPNSGSNTLQLIATKNGISDTLTRTVNVTPLPVVNPFTVIKDSICQNGQGRFFIPNSQISVGYRLFDGAIQVGSVWFGTGDTITLTTATNQSVVKPYRIQAIFSNTCGADTLEVIDSLYLAIPAPNVSAMLYRDTICTGDTTTMLIYNSEPGWEYYCSNATFIRVDGNGGTIGIPVGPVTGNVTITVMARFKSVNCFKTLPGSFPLVFRSSSINIPGTLQGPVGQPIPMTATSAGFNTWLWDFGGTATPLTGSGQVPSPPTYSIAGIDTVTLTARLNNTCVKTIKKPVYIYGNLPTSTTQLCDADTLTGTIANTANRFYLDDYNNLHVAGYESQSTNFAFTPYIMRLDINGNRIFYHRFNRFGNNPGAQGLINGITADRYTNMYFATRYNAPTRFDVQGNYIRNKNAVIKLNSKGTFEWAIEAPLADFSDMITIDNRIFAIGVNAWKGCELQTPVGLYRYVPSISNKGEAFIMELNPDGEVLNFDAFGSTGTAGVNSPAQFRAKYTIVNQYFDYDTLRQNLMARKSNNNELLIAGLLGSASLSTPVYFNSQVVNNNLPVGTGSEKCLFISRYDLNGSFTQATTLMSGRPELIYDFRENINGHYLVAGRARNNVVTSNGTLTFPVQNYDYQFLASFTPSGALDWLVYADSMNFKSIGINNDGSASLLVTMTTKFLIVDATGSPFNVSPAPSFGTYLLRFGLNGELLSADRTAGFDGLTLKQDACGNHHVYHSTNMANQFRAYRSIHSNNGSCSNNCYAAYDPNLLDVALDSVNLSNISTSGSSVRDLILKLKSNSVIPVTAIELKYRINNDPVQTLNWNGTLLTGDSLSLTVNSYNFNKNYNKIRVWIQQVNGTADDYPENDTIIQRQIICSSPLAGTYSAGCDTCYFDEIQATATTLKVCGVSDPVTMAIEPGEYYDQIQIDSIPFANSNDTIVWTSRTGNANDVVIYFKTDYSFNRSLIELNNADYCSFTHLTLKNRLPKAFDAMISGSMKSVIVMQFSEQINIQNCHLIGPEETGGVGMAANVVESFSSEHLTIKDNYIEDGDLAINLTVSSTDTIRNIELSGNTAWQTDGFHLFNVSNVLIDRNSIQSIGSGHASQMLINQCDSFRITNNIVTSENWGNKVFDVFCECPVANPCLIANNIFACSPLWLSTAGTEIIGDNLDIIHNSFGQGIEILSGGGLRFMNNLVRSNGNFVMDVSSPTFISSMNYNRYQSIGSSLNFRNNGNNYTLAGWRTLSGFDLQSDTVTAHFTTLTDMHLRNSVSMPGISWPGITTDIDGDTRSSTPTIGADEYSFNSLISEVWPGDCDSSKLVDNFDLLPIGLYYSRFSTSRPNEDATSWSAQPSLLWSDLQSNGINLNHADANGDGWIDLEDTTVVIDNYGQLRPLANPDPLRPSTGPDLAVVPVGTTYNAGDTVRLKILAGTVALPVEQLSAIGFKVSVPPSLIVPGSYRVSISGNWLCPDSNCIQFHRPDESTGIAAVSLVRLDADQVSSHGELAEISFVVNAAYTGSTTITIPVSDYRSFEPDATPISLSLIDGVIQVVGTSLEEHAFPDGIRIYPNPATQSAVLLYNYRGSSVTPVQLWITDITGRLVMTHQNLPGSAGVHQVPIDCSALQPGVYLMRVGAGKEQKVVRFIRQ